MNIAIIGATGMVGNSVAVEAGLRGHVLTLTSRSSPWRPAPPSDSVHLLLDAGDRAEVQKVLEGVDAAVVSVRPTVGSEATLAPLTATILDAAIPTGTHLLVVGGASPLRTPRDPSRRVLDDLLYVPEQFKAIASASAAQLHACVSHPNTAWTYLSPPAVLEPGERTGRYRRGTTTLLVDEDGTSRISVEDLAVAVVDELEHPGVDRHFTVGQIEQGLHQ